MNIEELLGPIESFLQCETPAAWLNKAKNAEHLPTLLLDHLMCELKAAQTAMLLIRKYAVNKDSSAALMQWFKPYEDFVYRKEGEMSELSRFSYLSKDIVADENLPYGQDLVDKMVLLIKEELHHFYQVLEIMQARDIPYHNIRAGRYAKGMIKHVRTYEPAALVDKLVIGAYIEARSCERFAKLAPLLDDDLHKFYVSLLRSEARHYQDYLNLAEKIAGQDISDRIKLFGEVEAQLINDADEDFKFHSGMPLN